MSNVFTLCFIQNNYLWIKDTIIEFRNFYKESYFQRGDLRTIWNETFDSVSNITKKNELPIKQNSVTIATCKVVQKGSSVCNTVL